MSSAKEFIVYDRQLLVTLCELRREAKADSARLGALVDEVRRAPEPPISKAERERASANLARFRAINAPSSIVRNHRITYDTKRYLLQKMKRGRVPNSWVFGQLAVRKTMKMDDSLDFAYWLVDPERRKPEHVLAPKPNEAINFWLLNLPRTDGR